MNKYKCYLLILITIVVLFISIIKLAPYKKKNEKFVNNKKTVRFLSNYFFNKDSRYALQSFEQFCKYFLSDVFEYQKVDKNNQADICIIDIYYIVNESEIRQTEYNILVSIENIPKWKNVLNHYKFINQYGEEDNQSIDLYFYNHYSNVSSTKYQKQIIPTIYSYMKEYQQANYASIVPFKSRKDILIINKSNLNSDIQKLIQEIKDNLNLKISYIHDYDETISIKSCYHSPELLSVFSQFKFILCIENSYHQGYVTEKIFNCFLSNSIPLYMGAPDISNFIYEKAFINLRSDDWINTVKTIYNSEELFGSIIQHPKITDLSLISHINNVDYKK